MGEKHQRKVHREALEIDICIDFLENLPNDSNEWNSSPTVGCVEMPFYQISVCFHAEQVIAMG